MCPRSRAHFFNNLHTHHYLLFKMYLKFFRIKYFKRQRRKPRSKAKSHPHFLSNKDAAHALVISRLEHFNTSYNFKYNKITIRNQTSRWGSCSRKGNLNFNFRIALLPPDLADYIIVHELCHLGEFNHSRKFWDLVERTVPGWKEARGRLKEEGKRVF